ncbi:hypothetical protein C0991_000314 [Blastosporella zonata]|nr:hypothetical protein C0991_000314 [Blastosporella zonata]
MVLIASRDKPLPHTGKGAVMRKATLEVYAPEIDALYDNLVSTTRSSLHRGMSPTWKAGSWEKAVEVKYGKGLLPGVNLFEQGFDSLSATMLRLRIVNSMLGSNVQEVQGALDKVTLNFIYQTPAICDMSTQLVSMCAFTDLAHAPRGNNLIDALIKKYTAGFPIRSQAPVNSPLQSRAIVFLTGSTGHIGS